VASTAQRNHMGAFMDYLVHKTAQIHYRQYRPMDLPTWSEAHLRAVLDNGGDVWADCSEGSYTVWHAGGLHPPGGSWEYGNTDTVYEHLPHYHDARRALIGAAVVWGEFPGTHHMALVRHPDPKYGNPLLWSLGQESDPRFISLIDETRAQRGRPYTFCSIAKL
jgi:hypothetical protein